MDQEIQKLKEAVARVVVILRSDRALTSAEEDTIASEVGRVRSELGFWRKRRAPNQSAA